MSDTPRAPLEHWSLVCEDCGSSSWFEDAVTAWECQTCGCRTGHYVPRQPVEDAGEQVSEQ